MAVYLGIDPSLRSTGICLLGDKGNYLRGWQIKTSAKDSLPENLGTIRKELDHVKIYLASGIEFANLQCTAIETPFVGNNKLTAHILSAVWGCIISEIVATWNPLDLIEVHPGALKRFVTGNNAADKKKIANGVFRKWQFRHECQDVIEAFALAQMARCLHEPNDFTRAQYDIIQDFLRLRYAAAGAADA